MAAEPGAGGDRRAGAARARDRAHRRRGADAPGGAAGSAGRAGRAPRDRDALPPWSALTQGARDPQGRRLFESAESPGRDRRVGGERGPVTAALLSGLHVRMPKGGLEPPRACAHWLLKPARLPVPPLRRIELRKIEIEIRQVNALWCHAESTSRSNSQRD